MMYSRNCTMQGCLTASDDSSQYTHLWTSDVLRCLLYKNNMHRNSSMQLRTAKSLAYLSRDPIAAFLGASVGSARLSRRNACDCAEKFIISARSIAKRAKRALERLYRVSALA